MLRINQHFGKHCSCHLQGEYVTDGHFWKPYKGQTVGGELELRVLIGGAEKQAAIQLEMNMWLTKRGIEKNFSLRLHSCFTNQHPQIQLTSYCLPNIRLPKMPIHYIFTLKMVTAMFAETLVNSQHLTQLIPKSQSCTFQFC
jgi:hypothetical protein